MSKTIKVILISLILLALSVTLIACNNSDEEVDPGFKLEQVNAGASYTFVVDELDLSQIQINQISTDSGEILAVFYAGKSLLSEDDLVKLTKPGTYTVNFTYAGVSLPITITIVPKSVVQLYTINFNAGECSFSGSTSNEVTYTVSTVTTIPIPVRTGFEFGGWYFNKNYTGDKLVAPYELNSNTKVYAKWIDERQFTVVFRSDLSQEVIKRFENVEYGTAIIAPQAPTVSGHTFTGWRGTFDNVTSDGTVWAEYSRIRVTITYTSDVWSETTGNATRSISLYYGETLEDPEPLPQKTGYTGVWLDEDTGSAPVYEEITHDMSIIAKYTIITYTVSFYVPSDCTDNSGDALKFTRTVNYNSTILQIPAVPTVDGYSGYWKIYENGRLVNTDMTQNITANLAVYARYIKKEYTVSFNYDGNKAEAKYAYGDYVEAYETGINTKYYSLEWYNAATFAADKKVSFPYKVTSNVSFYLKKTALPYTVQFCMPDNDYAGNPIENYLGDKIISETSVLPNGSVISPTISLDKYDLIGWIDATTGEAANFEAITDFHEYNEDSALDCAFYAVLKVKEFAIDFYNMTIVTQNGIDTIVFEEITATGATHFETEVSFDTYYTTTPASADIIKPTYPDGADDQFEFIGWFNTSDFSTASIDFTSGYRITADACFYAKWVDKNKGSEELIYALNDDGLTYSVIGYNTANLEFTTVAQVNIPRVYSATNGVTGPVTTICEEAFQGAETVKILAIELTPNVTTIENNAFASCKYLQNFIFEGNVTAFVKDETNVLFSADSTVLYRFPNASEVTSYEIPSTVTTVCGGAFAFSTLSEVTFEAGSALTTVSNGAFTAMTNLTAVALPDTLVTIESDAFRDCAFLETVTVPETNALVFVGENAFTDTLWWSTQKTQAKRVALGRVLIFYCDYTATSLDLSDYISVSDGALGGSDASHSLTFALKSITVGSASTLANIGEYAFSACAVLTSVYFRSNVEIDVAATAFDGIATNAKLYVTSSTYAYYSTDANILAHFNLSDIIIA